MKSELSEHREQYRKLRTSVYLEATKPDNNDPVRHDSNKEKLRTSITRICDNARLPRIIDGGEKATNLIWHHLWTKIRYAGIRASLASKEIDHIKEIFDNYSQFDSPDWDLDSKGHSLISAGPMAQHFLERTGPFANKQTVGNLSKLKKTVAIARAFSSFIATKPDETPVLNFVTGGLDPENIWEIHERLQSLGYKGDLTALHFMMDIGLPVVKPDIVVSKLFLHFGWLEAAAPELPEDLTEADLRGVGKYRSRFQYTNKVIYKPIIEYARNIVAGLDKRDLKDRGN